MSSAHRSNDYARYPFEKIPKRIFLDTNVINALVKHAEEVFEQQTIASDIHATLAGDIEALSQIFFIGARANWDIVASPKTLEELAETKNAHLRQRLMSFGLEAINRNVSDEDRQFAADFGRKLVDTHFVAALPDHADRELIGNALGYGCDAFCTRDRSTIVKKGDRLKSLGLNILTPEEWWTRIRPWAALWC